MNKYFVTFEQALSLKELGFDEPCLAWFGSMLVLALEKTAKNRSGNSNINKKWNGCANIPLYSQAFEWFRNNHLLEATINRSWSMHSSYHYVIINNMDYDNLIQQESTSNRTYQQAESACLDELIKIVKQC